MFRVRRKASWQADEAERRRSADQSFLLLEERGKMIISQEEIEAEPMSAEEASATSSSIEAAALRPSLEERIEYNPLKVKLLARSQAIAANCRQRAHTAFLLLEDMAPVARTRSRGRSASPSAAWRCIPSPLLADGDRQSLGDSAWITQDLLVNVWLTYCIAFLVSLTTFAPGRRIPQPREVVVPGWHEAEGSQGCVHSRRFVEDDRQTSEKHLDILDTSDGRELVTPTAPPQQPPNEEELTKNKTQAQEKEEEKKVEEGSASSCTSDAKTKVSEAADKQEASPIRNRTDHGPILHPPSYTLVVYSFRLAMPLITVSVMVHLLLFGMSASDELSSCVGCIHDENMLLQAVKAQHRWRRRRWAPWRFGRYGRHYGRYYGHYYGPKTTTERTTSASPTTTTTSSTNAIVCTGGNANEGQGQELRANPNPAQNIITINSSVTSPECQCVGGTSGDTLVPGYLSIVAGPLSDFDEVRFISVTSPNGTEMNLTTILATDRTRPFNVAGTVAFNGFSAIGGWVIKLLDGSGNLATSKASVAILRFGLQPCDRIKPAADCFGNMFSGKFAFFYNQSLVGTTLSATETAVQFHADLPAACCVAAVSPFMQLQFSNSPPISGIVSADGRSPDPDGANLTMTGEVQAESGLRTVNLPTQPPVAGSVATGLWNFNISTAGFEAVIGNTLRDPLLIIILEPCS
ncbi:unnamed protein product [Symbiodinium sp. CCMP2592]|nr:unnamed protein product [Symbiodinium sp. CCMP2592]